MIDATLADETGRFRWSVRLMDWAEVEVSTPAGWAALPGVHDPATHWLVSGAAVARPETGLPAAASIVAGVEWPVADVPEGTAVLVDGIEAGTVDAGGLVLEFPVPATYRVELLPPFPHRGAVCDVTVTP